MRSLLSDPLLWPLFAALAALWVAVWRRCKQRAPFAATVVWVCDGDSIYVRNTQGKKLKLRLVAMDAPETQQSGGSEATRALRSIVGKARVQVRVCDVDVYGRLVAQVWLDGRDVGLEMIARGQAWLYPRFLGLLASDDRARYRAAAKDARSRRLGLWRETAPMPPWLWRRAQRTLWQRCLLWCRVKLMRLFGLRF